nr:hypothetical protein [Paraburkholderia edwinii]
MLSVFRQLLEQWSQLFQRQRKLRIVAIQSAHRHSRRLSLCGVLDYPDTAGEPDLSKAKRPIAAATGQNHSSHSRAIAFGCGLEQSVRGWPYAVQFGPSVESQYFAGHNDQVSVGRRNVHLACVYAIAISSIRDRKRRVPLYDAIQHSRASRPCVKDHQYRAGEPAVK